MNVRESYSRALEEVTLLGVVDSDEVHLHKSRFCLRTGSHYLFIAINFEEVSSLLGPNEDKMTAHKMRGKLSYQNGRSATRKKGSLEYKRPLIDRGSETVRSMDHKIGIGGEEKRLNLC